MAGRKSLKEEIKIVERMSELSLPVFNYLKLCAESGDKEDKQWAVEQMMKLYAKAVPTEITGDPENPFEVKVVQVAKEVADKNNVIDTSTSDNSEGQAQV